MLSLQEKKRELMGRAFGMETQSQEDRRRQRVRDIKHLIGLWPRNTGGYHLVIGLLIECFHPTWFLRVFAWQFFLGLQIFCWTKNVDCWKVATEKRNDSQWQRAENWKATTADSWIQFLIRCSFFPLRKKKRISLSGWRKLIITMMVPVKCGTSFSLVSVQ